MSAAGPGPGPDPGPQERDPGHGPGTARPGSPQEELDFSILFDYDYLKPIEGAKRRYSSTGLYGSQLPPSSPRQSRSPSPQPSPRLPPREDSSAVPYTPLPSAPLPMDAMSSLPTDPSCGVPTKIWKTSPDPSPMASHKNSIPCHVFQTVDFHGPCEQEDRRNSAPESILLVPPSWTKQLVPAIPICSLPVQSLPPLEWPLASQSGSYELRIEVQPKPHHRAHYETEGSRGAVKAPTGGHPVVQLHGYMENKPLGLQIFIGTADERILKPHAFYQVHRITGKTVTTTSYEKIIGNTKVLEIPLEPKNNMKATALEGDTVTWARLQSPAAAQHPRCAKGGDSSLVPALELNSTSLDAAGGGILSPAQLLWFPGPDLACPESGDRSSSSGDRSSSRDRSSSVDWSSSGNSIDCAGILKLRNADIELRKGETDIGRKNTRVRLVFRVHIPEPSGRVVSLQAASNPIECSQRSAHELPMVERQDIDSCLVYGGQQMILTGQNFTAESKVVFTEKTSDGQQIWEMEATVDKDKSQPSMLFVEIPEYRNKHIRTAVKVNFYVINGKRKRSQPQHFTYHPVPSIKTEPIDDYDPALICSAVHSALGTVTQPYYSQHSVATESPSCLVATMAPCQQLRSGLSSPDSRYHQQSPAVIYQRSKSLSPSQLGYQQPSLMATPVAIADAHRSVLVHAGSPAQSSAVLQSPAQQQQQQQQPSPVIHYSPNNQQLRCGSHQEFQHIMCCENFAPGVPRSSQPQASQAQRLSPSSYPTVIQQQAAPGQRAAKNGPPGSEQKEVLPTGVTIKQEQNLDQAYLDDGRQLLAIWLIGSFIKACFWQEEINVRLIVQLDTAITESSSKPNIDFSGSRVRLLQILLEMQDVLVQKCRPDCHKW
ncbi:hypothetical protein Nmel_015187 [Mimus melanotis]